LKTIRRYLILIIICVAFSLAVTLATYFYSRWEGEWLIHVNRGLPLPWAVETGAHVPEDVGAQGLYPFDFQALNFSLDLVFWTTVLLLPSFFYLYRSIRRVLLYLGISIAVFLSSAVLVGYGTYVSRYEQAFSLFLAHPRFFLVDFVCEAFGINYYQSMWLLWFVGVLGMIGGLLGIVRVIKELVYLHLRKRTKAERLSTSSAKQF
jgi:hypothetical protein